MMRVQKTTERQVMVAFEPDRLALERLARTYVRLVPVPERRARRLEPGPRLQWGARTDRRQEVAQ